MGANSLSVRFIEAKNEWEQFMEIQKPQTFLHSWGWGEFHEKMGSKIFRLGVFVDEKMVAASLILKISAKRGTFLFCPHGPIYQEGFSKEEILETLTAFLKDLGRKEHCDFIRISPLLQKTEEHEKLFLNLNYREAPIHMHSELAWILDVRPEEQKILMDMRKTTRYCIKKAEKDGVQIEMSSNPDDVETFWKVYQTTVDRQNFTPFSKKYLRDEFETFSKDGNALFFFAKYNEEVVAAAIIIFYQGSAFYHHGASTHQYPKITAPYLLQWAVIEEAKRRECRCYDFWGISPEDKPKHPWAGISLFKKGFGGSATEYVHAKDFALKSKYWVSYVVESVRRRKRGL